MKYGFHCITFGCQMNVNDSAWLSRALTQRGWEERSLEEADAVLVNTCSVREKPEQKVYSTLGMIRRANPRAVVGVAGCVAQQLGEKLMEKSQQVRLVMGSDGIIHAPEAFERLLQDDSLRLTYLEFTESYPDRDPVLRPYTEICAAGEARPKEEGGAAVENCADGENCADAASEAGAREGVCTKGVRSEKYPDAACAKVCTDSSASRDVRAAAGADAKGCVDQSSAEKSEAAAFVNIMQGCDNYCAYCIVPYTRGPRKSRQTTAIIEECEGWLARGIKDITLLGQNVNVFGQDKTADGTSFPELLRKVAALKGLERLHFVSPHPRDFSRETVDAFGEMEVLAPRLHLPLQAGSDRILKKMGRGYTMEKFLQLTRDLRAVRPDIALSTDLIVGFPGETEEDFQETLRAMREVPFMSSFSFCYSDRPGTRASRMTDKIAPEIQQERLVRLQTLQDELGAQWLKTFVGRTCKVLIEAPSKRQPVDSSQSWQGHDEWGNTVNVRSAGALKVGDILPVRIEIARKHSLGGSLLV